MLGRWWGSRRTKSSRWIGLGADVGSQKRAEAQETSFLGTDTRVHQHQEIPWMGIHKGSTNGDVPVHPCTCTPTPGKSSCTLACANQHHKSPLARANRGLHPSVHPSTEDAPVSMPPQHHGTSPCPPTRVPKHLHGVWGCWARLEAEPPPGPASHPFCRIGASCQEPDLWVRGRGPRPAPGTGPSLELTLSLRGRILDPLHPSGTRGGCNPAREPSSITLPSSFPN